MRSQDAPFAKAADRLSNRDVVAWCAAHSRDARPTHNSCVTSSALRVDGTPGVVVGTFEVVPDRGRPWFGDTSGSRDLRPWSMGGNCDRLIG